MTRLLVVASDPMEFSGILAHAGEIRKISLRADWARRVRMANDEWLLVANGVGSPRAAAAVDAALENDRPGAVASIGFCGALEPELGLGEVVVATEVAGDNGRFAALPLTGPFPHHWGVVCTIDHIAQSAAEKGRLRASGASAVEMEAAAVAGRAARHALPFYCVKAVTDLAGENLANDLNGALRSDGHFDTIRILGSLLRYPLARVPELVRLRKRSVRAAHVLGDFFADCRF